jgi:hypothetical protein
MPKIAIALSLLVSLAACGGGKGPTEVCTAADECAEGLSCIALQNSSGGQCTGSPGSSCTINCADDAECNALEAGLVCLMQCDGMKLCSRLAGG